MYSFPSSSSKKKKTARELTLVVPSTAGGGDEKTKEPQSASSHATSGPPPSTTPQSSSSSAVLATGTTSQSKDATTLLSVSTLYERLDGSKTKVGTLDPKLTHLLHAVSVQRGANAQPTDLYPSRSVQSVQSFTEALKSKTLTLVGSYKRPASSKGHRSNAWSIMGPDDDARWQNIPRVQHRPRKRRWAHLLSTDSDTNTTVVSSVANQQQQQRFLTDLHNSWNQYVHQLVVETNPSVARRQRLDESSAAIATSLQSFFSQLAWSMEWVGCRVQVVTCPARRPWEGTWKGILVARTAHTWVLWETPPHDDEGMKETTSRTSLSAPEAAGTTTPGNVVASSRNDDPTATTDPSTKFKMKAKRRILPKRNTIVNIPIKWSVGKDDSTKKTFLVRLDLTNL